MEKRVTIYDIARKLNISTATVNRALTGKPRVREETRQLVIRTAEEMGFKPNRAARSLARRIVRLAAVGFTSFPEFHGRFLDGARQAGLELEDFNARVDCFSYDEGPSDTPGALRFLRETLGHIAASEYDGVLVLGRSDQNFDALREKGVCVATAVNDVQQAHRRFAVCYKSRIAGRMAAEMMYRMMPDRTRPVAIASGFETMVVHQQTELGFRQQMRSMPLRLAHVTYNHDNQERAFDSTCEMLRKSPEIGGIYINSFNCSGVIEAIERMGRSGEILLITSDISRQLRSLIASGRVAASIFQNQFEQGRLGIHTLYEYLANGVAPADTIAIDPQIILESNLELFDS